MISAAITSALELWNKAQLQELQKQLDQQSIEIVEQQQKSLESRKRLAQQTKEFKREQPQVVEAVKGLLKEYQMEIDSSAKRSKLVESWFLGLYKVLVDVPDPAPLLVSCMSELKKLDDIDTYVKENNSLKDQIASLSQQLVPTSEIESYKAKISYFESMLDTLVSERVSMITQELKDEFAEKVTSYKETEASLQKQITHLKEQFVSLQSQQEFTMATQVLPVQETPSSKQAELEICLVELENANAKCVSLQRENMMLKQQLEQSFVEQDNQRVIELEQELIQSRQEYELVSSQLQQREAEISVLLSDTESKSLALQTQVDALQSKIHGMGDYDTLKQELEILKSIEAGDPSQPLEHLLLEKNKRLENDFTVLKRDFGELSVVLDQTMQKNQDLVTQLTSKSNLISKLEQDLQKMERVQPNNVIESLVNKKEEGIIPILTAQRDRYKQRFEEAQSKMNQLNQRIQTLEYELAKLRDDNVSMYEKLRYQETYTRSLEQDETIQRYKPMYETKLDPFAEFKNRETRSKELNTAERVVMIITKMIIGNKYSRMVFVFYSVALHILVFFALYEVMSLDCNITPVKTRPNTTGK